MLVWHRHHIDGLFTCFGDDNFTLHQLTINMTPTLCTRPKELYDAAVQNRRKGRVSFGADSSAAANFNALGGAVILGTDFNTSKPPLRKPINDYAIWGKPGAPFGPGTYLDHGLLHDRSPLLGDFFGIFGEIFV